MLKLMDIIQHNEDLFSLDLLSLPDFEINNESTEVHKWELMHTPNYHDTFQYKGQVDRETGLPYGLGVKVY